MTEKQALELTAEMWDIVAQESCEKNRAISIMFRRNTTIPIRPNNDCFICEYYRQKFNNDECPGKCIMAEVWRGKRVYACYFYHASPYRKWAEYSGFRHNKREAARQAKKIADGARKILKETVN